MNHSDLIFYIGGKEVGAVKENTITLADEDNTPSLQCPPQKFSFNVIMSEEENEAIQWFLSRPERIRKYLKQIFRR